MTDNSELFRFTRLLSQKEVQRLLVDSEIADPAVKNGQLLIDHVALCLRTNQGAEDLSQKAYVVLGRHRGADERQIAVWWCLFSRGVRLSGRTTFMTEAHLVSIGYPDHPILGAAQELGVTIDNLLEIVDLTLIAA